MIKGNPRGASRHGHDRPVRGVLMPGYSLAVAAAFAEKCRCPDDKVLAKQLGNGLENLGLNPEVEPSGTRVGLNHIGEIVRIKVRTRCEQRFRTLLDRRDDVFAQLERRSDLAGLVILGDFFGCKHGSSLFVDGAVNKKVVMRLSVQQVPP